MQIAFKRHEKVKLLINPNLEYIEYEPGFENSPIKKGATGKVNIILPNGQYHVAIENKKGEKIAYVPVSEDSIESIE